MLWALYGLIHSLSRAAFVETNRIFKIDSLKLSFWQAVVAVVVLHVAWLFYGIPDFIWETWDAGSFGAFLFAAVIVGMVFTVGVLIQHNLVNMQQARVSNVYMPLEALTAFIIWVALTPAQSAADIGSFANGALILLAFLVATAGLFKVRKTDIRSFQSFTIVAPVGLTYATAGVVTKIVLPEVEVVPVAITFVVINYAVMAALFGVILLARKQANRDLFDGAVIRGGVFAGLFGMIAHLTFVISVALAPNPGYTSMLVMLLPVWLFVYHKLSGRDDDAHPVAALAITVGVVLLISATLL